MPEMSIRCGSQAAIWRLLATRIPVLPLDRNRKYPGFAVLSPGYAC
jgi:hypothetical protein